MVDNPRSLVGMLDSDNDVGHYNATGTLFVSTARIHQPQDVGDPIPEMPTASAPPATSMPAEPPETINGYAQAFSQMMAGPRPLPAPAPANTTAGEASPALAQPSPPADPSPQRPKQRPPGITSDTPVFSMDSDSDSFERGEQDIEQTVKNMHSTLNRFIDHTNAQFIRHNENITRCFESHGKSYRALRDDFENANNATLEMSDVIQKHSHDIDSVKTQMLTLVDAVTEVADTMAKRPGSDPPAASGLGPPDQETLYHSTILPSNSVCGFNVSLSCLNSTSPMLVSSNCNFFGVGSGLSSTSAFV